MHKADHGEGPSCEPEEQKSGGERQCDPPFSPEENDVLIDKIRPVYDKLFGKLATRTSYSEKNNIWRRIAKAVNAVSDHPRSIPKCKKRFNDIKRKVKEKLVKIDNHNRRTGGHPPLRLPFCQYERITRDLIHPAMITGIHCVIDTLQNVAGPSNAPTRISFPLQPSTNKVKEEPPLSPEEDSSQDAYLLPEPKEDSPFEEVSADVRVIRLNPEDSGLQFDTTADLVLRPSPAAARISFPLQPTIEKVKEEPSLSLEQGESSQDAYLLREPIDNCPYGKAAADVRVIQLNQEGPGLQPEGNSADLMLIEQRALRRSLNRKLNLLNQTLQSIHTTSLQQTHAIVHQSTILDRIANSLEILAQAHTVTKHTPTENPQFSPPYAGAPPSRVGSLSCVFPRGPGSRRGQRGRPAIKHLLRDHTEAPLYKKPSFK
ncbi:uncharacterized protein LOC128652087 [Bombina bombina]|uniref:uncharacterized protein LOC128652087 n=1 Tax=Bombina bombina TaxID=8345 RepID=UPI00235A60B9|nr:uncharacterized protein LOC128652087 [Bombina bombina]